jgi:hypothetical protein
MPWILRVTSENRSFKVSSRSIGGDASALAIIAVTIRRSMSYCVTGSV